MNATEHLLTCLIEKCGEVIQAATKALRFGLDDQGPDRDKTNREDMQHELYQLWAVCDMLKTNHIIERYVDFNVMNDKKQAIISYMGYSRQTGALT